MKKFAIVLAVMLGIFCLNGIAFADTIVQGTVPKERKTVSQYDRALEHYNKGEYQKSINILKDYIKKTPDPWGYWLMGYSLYKLKRFDEANRYFKNAFLVDPSFSPTPTLEKELKHPYEPARPEGYPEGMAPSAGPSPIPKLQQGTTVVTEPAPAPAKEQPAAAPAPEAAPTPAAPAPSVPAPAAPVPAPAPATTAQAPEAVPPPAKEKVTPPTPKQPVPPPTQQTAQEPAQPETPQQAAPPPPPPAPKPAAKPAPKPMQGPFPSENPLAPLISNYIGLIAGLGTTMLLAVAGIGLLIYIIFCLIMYKIAKKLNVAAPGLAFVPVIQYWTFAACAGMSTLMTILLFLLQWIFFPLAWAIIFLGIAGQLGKSRILGFIIGLLYFIPIFWLVAWFAYARGGAAAARGTSSGMDEFDLGGEPDIPDLDFDLEEEEPAPKAKDKPAAPPAKEESSSYDDDWQLPGEEGGGEQSADEWQLPEEKDEGEQTVDDWQLPQDDEQ